MPRQGDMPSLRSSVPGLALLAMAALLLAACEKKPKQPPAVEPAARMLLEETGFADLPGWDGDALSEALPAIGRSCALLSAQPDSRGVGPNRLAGSVADWRGPCAAIGRLSGDDASLRATLQELFVAFKVVDTTAKDGLFTGYYEAELRGAWGPIDGYRWPLYGVPDDLVSVDLGRFRADLKGERIYGRVKGAALVPYYNRRDIDKGVLTGRRLELLWVSDPVDAFFLHVQGSGRVSLPDGSVVRVGFAGSNGLDFASIGVPGAGGSMQGIRKWLRANPTAATAILQRNPRYIFFRKIDGDGPIGAQGVALTPGRSLAVDPAFLPLGVPLWLDTTWPSSERPLRRLMVAQDTGNAIKGPIRGDFFWGFGEPALAEAGRMKQRGHYYLLLPKSVAERRRKTS